VSLFKLERFRQIVVGSGPQAGDLFPPGVARREDQHRHIAPVPPPALQHGEAVDHRQTEIEDHGIVRLGVAEKVPFLAVIGDIDDIAGVAQPRRNLPRDLAVILDDEYAHADRGPQSSAT
jgi:hypothetical protein